MKQRWGHSIKNSSRCVMVCRGSRDRPEDPQKWPITEKFNCLGHILEGCAGIRACFANVKRCMWKAFFANSGQRFFKNAHISTKLVLLSRACVPVLTHRCSRWPPQSGVAQELDRLQTKMVAALLRCAKATTETPAAYCRRRNKSAARLCKQSGRWSALWFQRSIDWNAHILRGHNPYSWPTLLIRYQDESWLNEQRLLSNFQGTQTRCTVGRPATRWHEGIAFADVMLRG